MPTLVPARPTTAPVSVVARATPQWFTAVMGTGIVATSAATLPVRLPLLDTAATAVWLLAAGLLVGLGAITARQWRDHPEVARGHLADPAVAPAYGAPAMALLTVGAGAVLVGTPLLGVAAARWLDAVLWTAGTALGLWAAVAVSVRAFLGGPTAPDAASATWLLPVVPPMVSAATLPLLLRHVPAGQARLTLLLLGYALVGVTLLAGLVILVLVWSRLAHHGPVPAAAVPTLWIVLGPLGQSVTAVHHLGVIAPQVLPTPYGAAFTALTLVYGLPVWGFALLWLALVGSLTVRAARDGLPFTPAWWSFTFPVGTLVTATSALAAATGAVVLAGLSVLLFAGLVVAWLLVGSRTVGCARGAVRLGRTGRMERWSRLAPTASARWR